MTVERDRAFECRGQKLGMLRRRSNERDACWQPPRPHDVLDQARMDLELHLQEESVKSRGQLGKVQVFIVRQDPCRFLAILLPLNPHDWRCERMVAHSGIESLP